MNKKKEKWRSVILLTALIFLTVISTDVYGLKTESDDSIIDTDDISLESLLNEKLSIASRILETTGTAPSSVTIFTQKEIESLGINYLEELFDFVPGFFPSREVEQGNMIRIGARGRSTALTESILFLLNGQRINDLYTGGASILNRHIAVENIKKVEIIRGPGSALYGANGFVGVVNIITLDDGSKFALEVGNLNSKSVSISLGKTVKDLSLWGFVKAFSDTGQYYENISDIFGRMGDTTDPRRGLDVNLSLKYKDITVFARHMERNYEDFLTWGTLQGMRDNSHEATGQSSFKLNYLKKFSDRLNFEWTAGYSHDLWKVTALNVPLGVELAPGFALEQSLISGPYQRTYTFMTDMMTRINFIPNNTFVLGATFEQSAITAVSNLMNHHPITLEYYGETVEQGGPSETYNEKKTRRIISAYAQNKHEFGKWLSIVVGLRYDYYNDFGSAISPRASVVISTPFHSQIKLIYGRAFRAPSFLELYDKNNPVDFGNPNLKPELINTYEVAYVQRIKHYLQATLTYFYSQISDLIVFGEPAEHINNPLGAPSFINSGSYNSQGLEFDFKASPSEKLLIFGCYTHLFNREGIPMPANFGSLAVNYHFGKFAATASCIFRDRINGFDLQDPYAIFNFKLQYATSSKFKLVCNVKNLFDTDYLSVSSVLPSGVPNRGRLFSFGLSYEL